MVIPRSLTAFTPANLTRPIDGFLNGKGDRARELFEGFERLIAAIGPYEVAPAKPAWPSRHAPTCGRRFVGQNMWHACGDYSVYSLPRALTEQASLI